MGCLGEKFRNTVSVYDRNALEFAFNTGFCLRRAQSSDVVIFKKKRFLSKTDECYQNCLPLLSELIHSSLFMNEQKIIICSRNPFFKSRTFYLSMLRLLACIISSVSSSQLHPRVIIIILFSRISEVLGCIVNKLGIVNSFHFFYSKNVKETRHITKHLYS